MRGALQLAQGRDFTVPFTVVPVKKEGSIPQYVFMLFRSKNLFSYIVYMSLDVQVLMA